MLLTETQQAAILMLSQAVADRPFSANVVVNDTMSLEQMIRQEILSPTATNGSTIEESGAIEAILVNTNQFYKWFTDLESAMKSEIEEKYQ